MTLIKRYPNRKLYDTEAKQYITLEGIANLIRQGQDISVIDHATGEDLTTLTLTQIIVEQEKRQGGLFPRSVLAGLIQAGEDRLEAIQRLFAAPINSLLQFDEEIKRRIQDLVKRGELSEREGQNLIDQLLNQTILHPGQGVPTVDLEHILAKFQVPTQDDLKKLNQQIDELAAKINDMTG